MRKRIGIFSGTFDPIHEGHVAFVAAACRLLKLNQVRVVVERKPRHKRPYASLKHRLAMVDMAFRGNPSVTVLPSRTDITTFGDIETLSTTSEVWLLIGSDVVAGMAEWKNLSEYSAGIRVIVGLRSDDNKQVLEKQLKSYGFSERHIFISPLKDAASSKSRANPRELVPAIAEYVALHRLYT